jgi:mono/diheme cytochrome c family protein
MTLAISSRGVGLRRAVTLESFREGEPPCEPSASAGSDGASRSHGRRRGLDRTTYRFVVQAVFSGVAIACAIATVGGQTPKPNAVVPRTENAQSTHTTSSSTKVMQAYRTLCLECHDIDGRGEVVRDALKQIPDFTGSTWHASRTDAALSRSILEGKGKSMPKMKGKLGSVDVKEMVAFVRAFKDGKQVVPEEPEIAAEPEKPAARAATVAGSPQGVEPSLASQDRAKSDRPRSIELYRTHCLECHEEDGRGESSRELMRGIPDFTRPEWHHARDDASLQQSIREGKGMMPPKKDKLSPTDVVRLVSLIREFRGGEQVIPDEPEGREEPSKGTQPQTSAEPAEPGAGANRPASRSTSESKVPAPSEAIRGLFQRSCAKCHGADGHGNDLRGQFPQIPDFASSNWQKGRIDAQLTASILEGKGTAMPAFGGKLGEAQVRELITYLRSFAPAESRSISGTSDFYRRYLELRKEMDDLERQYRALSRR